MEQNLYALRITRYIHMRKNEREKEKVLEIIERERDSVYGKRKP